jgi:predicted anti-sigma-YlaC factor YlaD
MMNFKLLALCILFSACSMQKIAINSISDMLTGEGSSIVFTGDSDPKLVGDALPFTIKLYESLLAANPNHPGLLVTTGSLFVMYANAYVQTPAEMLPLAQYAEKLAAMDRAKKLYLRGLNLLYRCLELQYPGFSEAFQNDKQEEILSKTKKADVPALYWAAAGGLAAYSINPFDMDLGMRIPEFLALVKHAYLLDPDYNSGSLDQFLFLFYASVPQTIGGDAEKAKEHYAKALEKSKGMQPGPYISWAQTISIREQNHIEFKALLETALAIDIEKDPANRLVNEISRRKAQYLLNSMHQFFYALEDDE